VERSAPPPAPHQSPIRRLADNVAAVLVPSENPTGAIYGLMLVGALLAAESGSHESYADALLSTLLASVVFWLAHGYANALGRRLEERRRLTPRVLARAMVRSFALIRGDMVPLLSLTIAGIAGASEETAVNIAVWCTVVTLALLELLAGLRAGATSGELALETGVGVTLGISILALKIILH
jgi:hypothetical protein